LGVAVFFSKVIGVVFVFPFACYFAHRIGYEEEQRRTLVSRLKNPAVFAAGLAAVAVFFLFFTYLPMKEQVAQYLGEQSLSLYGAPEGLESFNDFVQKMVTLGDQTKLFPRMATVALLATVLIFQALYHVSRERSWREGFGSLGSGQVFMVAAIIAFYGSLMIWNYRPLRYQLIMIYPFYGAAAVVLTTLWGRWRGGREFRKTPWLFYLLGWPVAMTMIFQLGTGLAEHFGKDFYFDDKKYLVAFSSLVLMVIIGLLVSLYNKGTLPRPVRAAKILVVLVLVGVMAWGFAEYRFWWQRPTFMARDDSRDMQMILSPGAVISGPFAPLLTLENRLGTVIHMFGVSQADPDLFRRFPITHLLADKANEDRAEEDYPGLMDSSVRICTYHVGLKKARLIRIGGHTGNRRADAYRRSIFETAMDYFSSDSAILGNRLARQFMTANPENISGNLLMGEKAEMAEYMDEAEWLFKKAVEFSPTNYDLNARLAQFYRDQYERSEDPRFRTKAVEYFEHAIRYAPNVASIQKAYTELKGK
ncbi:MAG: hypothetical protein OEW00_07840, partial [candidate division Zixibacteria bacterium]|nr:hypothetical protein [candidate division Zixibacteria bacterium]